MAAPTKFWDRIAERYAQRPVSDESSYQKKLDVTREYFRPDMEVLEFGCGTGSTAIVHAPFVQHIRAVDFSAGMIEIARAKAAAANIRNVSFEHASIEAYEQADRSVDMVLALSLLHLLDDWQAMLEKVHAMLKPGGVFVSSTACLGDTQKFVGWIAPMGRLLGFMPLVRIFTRQELMEALQNAGFLIEHEWQPGKGKAVFIVAKKPAGD